MRNTKRFDIYPGDDLLKLLNEWRGSQADPPSRADAARMLLMQKLLEWKEAQDRLAVRRDKVSVTT